MIKVVVLGQGYVGSVFAVGLERIKSGQIKPYGVPLGEELPYGISDLEIVGSYDVDNSKVNRTVAEVCKRYCDVESEGNLSKVSVRRGIHLGSLRNLPISAKGLEDGMSLRDAVNRIADEWDELDVDVIVNLCTTEAFKPFETEEEFLNCIEDDRRERLTASQVYFYAACLYSEKRGGAVFVNAIPTLLANDPTLLKFAEKNSLIVFGDDGATGATPLTADVLGHLAQRNRFVKHVVQFNIGGNTDFLALSDEERNRSKEFTKSSIVKDILGYDAPHFIKPTGYLEPLGDKKFVSMHVEYESFNGQVDEIIINARINDSPALAGLIVDLVRLGKIALDRKVRGTVYEVNAFYMKNPGPKESKNIPRILAYEKLKDWVNS